MFCFIHIPKTGGTSVASVLGAHHRLLRLDSFDAVRDFLRHPTTDFTAITGHMAFGIHQHVPDIRYSVILRDPVDRIVSDYYFIRRTPTHRLHELATTKPLTDFPGGNSMTRRLFARRWAEILDTKAFWQERYPRGYCDEDMLESAKETLRQCEFVGIYDFYESDALRTLSLAGIDCAEVPRMNATENRPRLDEIDPAMIAALRERNRFDIALYDFAKALHG